MLEQVIVTFELWWTICLSTVYEEVGASVKVCNRNGLFLIDDECIMFDGPVADESLLLNGKRRRGKEGDCLSQECQKSVEKK